MIHTPPQQVMQDFHHLAALNCTAKKTPNSLGPSKLFQDYIKIIY